MGVVFEVWYDTEAWTWGIPWEKMAEIREQIRVILGLSEVHWDGIQSVVGRIMNVCALVPERLFHVHHLLSLVARSEVKSNLVEQKVGFKRQLHVWYVMLRVSSGRAAIPVALGRLLP